MPPLAKRFVAVADDDEGSACIGVTQSRVALSYTAIKKWVEASSPVLLTRACSTGAEFGRQIALCVGESSAADALKAAIRERRDAFPPENNPRWRWPHAWAKLNEIVIVAAAEHRLQIASISTPATMARCLGKELASDFAWLWKSHSRGCLGAFCFARR